MMPYKIQKGDTLSELAQRFNVPMSALADANQIADVDKIYYDRMLNIPVQQGGAQTFGIEGYDPSLIRGEHFVEGEADIGAYTGDKPTFSELGAAISGWSDRNREAHEELAEQHGSPSPEELGYTTAPAFSELGAAISGWWDSNRGTDADTPREPYASPWMIMAPSPEELEDSTKPTLGEWGRSIKSTGYDGLVGFINRLENVDQYIKGGQHEHDLRNFSNLLTSTYRSAKENFTEDLSIFKNDFLYTLRNFVDDNNLDKSGLDKLIQLIDVDWLYDATGVRNLRKERRAFQARAEAHRRKQEQEATVSSSYAQGGLAQQVRNVAAQGRYGDSMLMHVNPAEVRGLSQVAPITINPQTGQPEAFLPFLAPILGSMLGPSLFGALGATGALTGLAGSALGSGLAQWAATGDLKKGLLAGITGYGIGSALQGAAGAAGASAAGDLATTAATEARTIGQAATQEAIQSAMTQGGSEALLGATTAAPGVGYTSPLANLKSVFNPGAISEATASAAPNLLTAGTQAAPSLTTSLGNLATGLSQPAALAGIAGGMAPTSIMESQELYERQIAQRAREDEEKRRQNFLMNPEPILYSAQGGTTNIDKGLEMDSNLLSQQMMANGSRTNFNGGGFTDFDFNNPDFYGGRAGDNTYFSGDQQRFTPAREVYDVNPNFMAGFQPETMYFNPATINAPAVATSTGGPKSVPDTYEGSKGGYGVPSLSIAPQQIIDPYAAYTGPDPEGLIQGEVGILPITPPPPDGGIGDPGTGDPGAPIGAPPTGGGPGRGGPGMGGPGMGWLYDMLPDDLIDTGIGGGFGGGGFGGIGNINLSGLDDLDFSNFDFSGFNPTPPVMGPPAAVAPPAAIPSFTLPDDAIDTGIGGGPGMGGPGMGGPGMPIGAPPVLPPEFISPGQPPVEVPVAPPVQPPMGGGPGMGGPGMRPPMPRPPAMPPMPPPQVAPPVQPPMGFFGDTDTGDSPVAPPMRIEAPPLVEPPRPPIMPPPVMPPPQVAPPTMPSPPVMQPPAMPPMAPLPPPKSPPFFKISPPAKKKAKKKGKKKSKKGSSGRGRKREGGLIKMQEQGYQEGGIVDLAANNQAMMAEQMPSQPTTDLMQDPLTQETIQFLMGDTDNQQVVNDFIAKYGNEVFLQLRNSVLQALVPDAQTEGQIEGVGQSGMADDILGRIGADEKIAVSQDEFIVPADVVSALGDGSSDAGSNRLYEMMDRVRQAKTGGTTQPPMIDLNRVMPA